MKTNIYNTIVVISDEDNKFRVVLPYTDENNNIDFHTLAEADNVTVALALKKAYCDGYYDATHEE